MNIVFLREHNRIAGTCRRRYPDWDDERLFETTRNVMIVLTPEAGRRGVHQAHRPLRRSPLEVVPFIADGERWNRSNWIAIEFNLLYRWHSLVPDDQAGRGRLSDPGAAQQQPAGDRPGVESLIGRVLRRRAAGRSGWATRPGSWSTGNAPTGPSVEERTVALMRQARLRSFNDYREAFGLRRLADFD